MRVLILPYLMLSLTACGGTKVVREPEVITQTVREYINVPVHLTRQIDVQNIPDGMTYGEAIAILSKERETVDKLNGQLAGIESLEGTEE